jgi:hypothetical protein
MLTLSKKLAAGIAATTAVAAVALAAPQAQAATMYPFSFNGSRTGPASGVDLTTVGFAIAGDPAQQAFVGALIPGGTMFELVFPSGFPGIFPNIRPVTLTDFSLGGIAFTVVDNPQSAFRTGASQTFGTVQFTFE